MEDREEPDSWSPRIQGPGSGTCYKGLGAPSFLSLCLSRFSPFCSLMCPKHGESIGEWGFSLLRALFNTAQKELNSRQTDRLGWKQSVDRKGLCEMQANVTGHPAENWQAGSS